MTLTHIAWGIYTFVVCSTVASVAFLVTLVLMRKLIGVFYE
jgi:hypothetical protein